MLKAEEISKCVFLDLEQFKAKQQKVRHTRICRVCDKPFNATHSQEQEYRKNGTPMMSGVCSDACLTKTITFKCLDCGKQIKPGDDWFAARRCSSCMTNKGEISFDERRDQENVEEPEPSPEDLGADLSTPPEY